MANGTAGKWGCGCLCIVVGIPLVLCLIESTIEEFQSLMSEQNARAERRRENERMKADAKNTAERAAKERDSAAAGKEKIETERKTSAEAARKAANAREDRLRSFVLKDAPELWRAYQELGVQIELQGKRIDDLRNTLVTFDKDPETDADFSRLTAMRKSMIEVRASLRRKIEDAYLAFKKFEATPSRRDYDELRRKTIEDGVLEAEAAKRRFDAMRKEKP